MSGPRLRFGSVALLAGYGAGKKTMGLAFLWIYLLVAVMFTGIYLQMTIPWSDADVTAFTRHSSAYGFYAPAFKYRILVPLLARAAAFLIPVPLVWIFRGLTVAFVFGSLLAYRKYLSNVMRTGFATVLAIGLIYPMVWNLCLLNRLYFPFDVPSLMFFILGCHFIYRRSWHAYYVLLALATLNRDTSFFLAVVFLFTMWREMTNRRLVAHLLAQAAVWLATKWLVCLALGYEQGAFTTYWFWPNVGWLRDTLLLKNNGVRDLIKILLCFGGIYWLLPWVLRGQPNFLMHSLLAAIPLLCAAMVMAVIDEMRGYVDIIPLVLTPLVYRIAGDLGGVVSSNSGAATMSYTSQAPPS